MKLVYQFYLKCTRLNYIKKLKLACSSILSYISLLSYTYHHLIM